MAIYREKDSKAWRVVYRFTTWKGVAIPLNEGVSRLWRAKKNDEDILTHCQVIQCLVIANVWVELAISATQRLAHTQFDTSSNSFSRFISHF